MGTGEKESPQQPQPRLSLEETAKDNEVEATTSHFAIPVDAEANKGEFRGKDKSSNEIIWFY